MSSLSRGGRYAIRQGRTIALAPKARREMECINNTLAYRTPFCGLKIVDACTQECVSVHVAPSYTGAILCAAGARRGKLP